MWERTNIVNHYICLYSEPVVRKSFLMVFLVVFQSFSQNSHSKMDIIFVDTHRRLNTQNLGIVCVCACVHVCTCVRARVTKVLCSF